MLPIDVLKESLGQVKVFPAKQLNGGSFQTAVKVLQLVLLHLNQAQFLDVKVVNLIINGFFPISSLYLR